MDKQTKYFLGIGAGGLLIYFGVLDPLFKALGITKKEETKIVEAELENPLSPWQPNFYKGKSGAPLLTMGVAEQYARTIYDSFGLFDDCEECAIGVFKQLRYQTQLSFLSEVFFKLYQQDLLTFLRGGLWPQDRLSDADVSALNSYLNNLPVK